MVGSVLDEGPIWSKIQQARTAADCPRLPRAMNPGHRLTSRHRLICRRLAIFACSLPLALGASACGSNVHHFADADGAGASGLYVDAGPITYQVELSRELSPYSVEDMEYLKGLTAPPLKPDEEWLGVFLWAKNQTGANQTTSDSFDIVDTQGNRYLPVPINAQLNPYAWTAQTIPPSGTEPVPSSTVSFGPTQGGELLFKINAAAYANRPLIFEIHAGGPANTASVTLGL